MTWATWWLFTCATAIVVASPGPNMLHIMVQSVRFGFARSIVSMAGCLTAVLICVTASSLGLGALLMTSHTLFGVLRYVGVAYLLYLAWKSWTAGVPAADAGATVPAAGGGSTFALYRAALLTGLSNPKLIVFAAAFFPQFIRADRPWAPQFAILVGTFAVIEVACYTAYAAGGRRLATALSSPARRRLFNRLTGAAFGTFGIGLFAWRA
ncbi:MAG: LysE family translocator [Sphingomonas fennica]